jgi:hypothetical protein
MDNNEIFNPLFGNKTPQELEELDEKNRKYELKLIEENPPLVMSFGKFAKGGFEQGHRNLYLVWRGKQVLYVGIGKSGIWNRWFGRGGQSHMYFAQKYSGTLEGGQWVGLSPIGRVIVHNQPASMRWKIEMRYIPFRQDLQTEERKLIHELHPLFNTTYLLPLTPKEQKIYEQLTKKELADIIDYPADQHISYEKKE